LVMPQPIRKSANSIAPIKTSGRKTSSPVKYPRKPVYKLA
jgi:hypothetical protein